MVTNEDSFSMQAVRPEYDLFSELPSHAALESDI